MSNFIHLDIQTEFVKEKHKKDIAFHKHIPAVYLSASIHGLAILVLLEWF